MILSYVATKNPSGGKMALVWLDAMVFVTISYLTYFVPLL